MSRLPRAMDALLQDSHSADDWHDALLPLDAAYGCEQDDGYGVYVELAGDEVKLHVPSVLVTEAREVGLTWRQADALESTLATAVRRWST